MLVQKNIEIRTERYSNGQLYYREFLVEGKRHRDPKDGPAYESFCESGQLRSREFLVEDRRLTDAEVATATTHPSCDGAVVEFQGRKYRLVEE